VEQNPIRNDARMAHRTRQVGKGAKCALCGEEDPRALVARSGRVLCYECVAEAQGKPRSENHHFPNRYNSLFIVGVPGNDHRVLTDRQKDWPMKTYRNPHGSPLLKAAAAIRGWLDMLRVIIDRGVGWIPAFLEDLDAWLEVHHGPDWWKQVPRR
jgi:hypothetical protein